MDLKDKTLIITGASMGMGRAVAKALVQLKARVVLNARHAAPLENAAQECEKLGGRVRWVAGNAAREKTMAQLVAAALGLGEFFGFIHAAGVLHPGPFLWELPGRRFQEVLESHVTAGHQLIRLAAPELLKRGEGLAVFFGSGAAAYNRAGIGAYCVAKAAEEHLARQLAEEAPQINTFIFHPGVVETRMQRQSRQAKGGAAEEVQRVFKGFKERGELRTPDEAARLLMDILTGEPRRFQGRIAK
jgi:NAD(P)-dependent dehydrogenase (short-subunit alcohol dehydrogenase family)